MAKLKLVAKRVDRVQHNDDIDNKLIELMQTSDLCIADLTYARPSVYYEAGDFSGLGKPVVFTSRKDHFKPIENDQFGNFRVHFDLQMKNIIAWTDPKRVDVFAKALQARLNLVTGPIYARSLATERATEQQKAFALLSPAERVGLIETEADKYLRQRLWKRQQIEHRRRRESPYYISSTGKSLIALNVTTSATADYMEKSNVYGWRHAFDEKLDAKHSMNVFFISLRKIPGARIEDVYESARPMRAGEVIALRVPPRLGSLPGRAGMPVYCRFISGCRSMQEFMNSLDKHIAEIEGRKA